MALSTALPPSVEPVIATYRDAIDRERLPPLRGLYLVGSLALGDFRPGASDIDFVALVDAPPTAEACAALERIHGTVAGAGGPCLDGFYLAADALRRPPMDYAVAPFSLDGRFRTGEICREINPVTWRCLALSGRTVFGPAPVDLGIADDPDWLRRYQIENLCSYWVSWMERCEAALVAKGVGEDCDAEALAWGVLGVSRIACALETDRVVSKGEGGLHALASYPARWRSVIQEALSAHAGTVRRVPVETVRDALAYMAFVIGHATGT